MRSWGRSSRRALLVELGGWQCGRRNPRGLLEGLGLAKPLPGLAGSLLGRCILGISDGFRVHRLGGGDFPKLRIGFDLLPFCHELCRLGNLEALCFLFVGIEGQVCVESQLLLGVEELIDFAGDANRAVLRCPKGTPPEIGEPPGPRTGVANA